MSSPERLADRLYCEDFLPEETRAIRAEARAFAETHVRPVAHRLNTTPERRDGFPHALYRAMAAAGLYRIPYPAELGGRGLRYPTLATVTVLEEIGYYSPGLASALFDGQAILVGKTLQAAPQALREAYLPRLIRGEFIGAFATSEPEASTDLSVQSLQTVATRCEGGYRVTGVKRWITNSVAAEAMLLLARLEDRMTMFLVDLDQPGVRVCDPDLKMGNHAQLTADVHFNDAFIPADRVVGEEGAGLRTAVGALVQGRIGIGAIGVAMAQAAFDWAADYTRQRKVFGQPIAAFQHWQFRFAEHALQIEQARSLYQKAALRLDTQGRCDLEAAMAKIAGSRLAVDVARDAIQACGGYGFVRELSGTGQPYPLEAIYRDAKIGEIYEGANEIQNWIIARHIFGRGITG